MSNPIEQVEMQKLFQELTDCIVFLGEEGFTMTRDRLIAVREGFRSLEQDHKTMKEALEDDRLCYCERNPWGNKPCNRCKTLSSLLTK